jgi:hypothetical protein
VLDLAKKEIDGHLYEFEQFGAKKATKLLVRIGRIAGGPLAIVGTQIVGQKDRKGLAEKLNSAEVISRVIEALTQKLDENEVLDIIETFTGGDKVLCDGKKISFDHHYQNRLDHMFRVLWAALEVQYGNFFGALTALMPSVPAQASSQPPQA